MRKSKRDRAAELLARGDAHRAALRLGQARSCYSEAAKIRAAIVANWGETPDALGDLNVYLQRLGDVELGLGRLNAAYQCFEQVRKALRMDLALAGETPQTLENLSAILARLGDVERDRGQLDGARSLYEQALGTHRKVLDIVGETAPALRALAARLERLGSVDHNIGQIDAAYARYEQSFETARKVLELTGDTPHALRGLIISLNCLANIECERGQIDAAYTRFAQMHEMAHRVIGLSGETPDALRGLRLSLEQLGDVERARGQFDAAYTRCEQALEIARKLLKVTREKPEALRDLSLSLGRIGDVEFALGRTDAAYVHFKEKFEVDSKTAMLMGEAPAALRELSFSLSLMGLVEYQRHHFDMAREHFSLAHDTACRALEIGGETPKVLCDINACLLAICDVESRTGQTARGIGRLDEALRLLPRIPTYLASWPEIALSWSERIVVQFADAAVSIDQAFVRRATLWRPVVEHLALSSVEAFERARPTVASFHRAWLRFALQRAPERVPEVLAAMQGRKLAAMVLEELEQQPVAEGPDAELRQRFLALRRELRRLALGLQVLEGGAGRPDADGQRSFGLERSGSANPEVVRARQAEYDATLAEYRQVRLELSKRPGFEALEPQTIDLAGLRPSLRADQALMVLVHTPGEAEPQTTGDAALAPAYALVLRSGGHTLVPVPELAHSPQRMQFTAVQHSRMAGMRYVAGSAGAAEPPAAEAADAAAAPLPEHLTQALWAPLREHLQGVRVLHVVTHGGLHVLPLQALAPQGIEVRQYPGLVFYWLQHLAPQRAAHAPEPATAVQVHSPEPGAVPPPIPFVHAEAGVLGSLWGEDRLHTPMPLAQPRVLAVAHLAGHGDSGSGADASLLIGPQEHLGLHQVLGGQLRPSIVYLSACLVGRITEDLDGDPLGLVSAYLLKGVRSVVAPLVPIPDRYAPVLAALWHWDIVQQIQAGLPLDAHRALAWAKARLRDGCWPEPVLQLLLQQYAKTMAGEIARLCQDAQHGSQADLFGALRRQFQDWLGKAGDRDLPYQLCDDILCARPEDLPAVIKQAAHALALQILGQPALLPSLPEVLALLNFVQVFGSGETREHSRAASSH